MPSLEDMDMACSWKCFVPIETYQHLEYETLPIRRLLLLCRWLDPPGVPAFQVLLSMQPHYPTNSTTIRVSPAMQIVSPHALGHKPILELKLSRIKANENPGLTTVSLSCKCKGAFSFLPRDWDWRSAGISSRSFYPPKLRKCVVTA